MQLIEPAGRDDAAWLAMRCALWPDDTPAGHLQGMADALGRGHHVRLAILDRSAVGFAEASLRNDYVNGTETSPVAFLEGLYVVPGARRQGVARAMTQEVVRWARAAHCTELASDALIDNTASHDFHRALRFEETERVVCFRRLLGA